MNSWTKENHQLCTETYLAIGKMWAKEVPNFALDDFVKLNGDLWSNIVSIEERIDHPNMTAAGIAHALDRLYNLWVELVALAKKENKQLLRMGCEIKPSPVSGIQIYRDVDHLKKNVFVNADGLSIDSLCAFLGGRCSLYEAFEAKQAPPLLYGVWVCDDGSIRASQRCVKSKGKEPAVENIVEPKPVDWTIKEDDVEDLEIAGFENSSSLEVLDPLDPAGLDSDKDGIFDLDISDIDIIEAYE